MQTDEIISLLNSLKLGDKLAINDWKAKYTVCGISQNYILAHYGQHYTIIQRTPMPDGYCYNGVRGGDIRCAPDWWIFGWMSDKWDDYQFNNEEWVKDYLYSLESGETEMSQKRHAPVWFLSVVGHTDAVYAKRKTPNNGG